VPVGPGVPEGQVSIQLYSFNTVIGNDPAKLEKVLAHLQASGYSAVEPYGVAYNIAPTAFRALLDKYDLRAVGRHDSVDESSWNTEIADAKIPGPGVHGQRRHPVPGCLPQGRPA
jgi:hypothetical protein